MLTSNFVHMVYILLYDDAHRGIFGLLCSSNSMATKMQPASCCYSSPQSTHSSTQFSSTHPEGSFAAKPHLQNMYKFSNSPSSHSSLTPARSQPSFISKTQPLSSWGAAGVSKTNWQCPSWRWSFVGGKISHLSTLFFNSNPKPTQLHF